MKMSEFQFSIPAYVLINDIAIILGLAVIGIVIWFYSKDKNRIIGISIIGGVIILFIYLSFIAPIQTNVVLNDRLELYIPPYARETIQKEEILRAYVIDLEHNESLQPKYHTFGAGMGNYKMGWFKLTNGKDAIMMTTGTKVVCLELEDKYIMLSPDNLNEFIEELNEEFIVIGYDEIE